jgi:hypothetical protein
MTTSVTTNNPDKVTDRPDPALDASTVVAIAWPTGRPIYRYTVEEIAEGVDLYTRAMKARAAGAERQGGDDAGQR